MIDTSELFSNYEEEMKNTNGFRSKKIRCGDYDYNIVVVLEGEPYASLRVMGWDGESVMLGDIIPKVFTRKLFNFMLLNRDNRPGFVEDLFEKGDRVQKSITEHPLQRGSGVWGDELSSGDLAYIDSTLIEKKYRGLGISKILLELAILASKKVLGDNGDLRFLLLMPGVTEDLPVDLQSLIEARREAETEGSTGECEVAACTAPCAGCQARRSMEEELLHAAMVKRATSFWLSRGAVRYGLDTPLQSACLQLQDFNLLKSLKHEVVQNGIPATLALLKASWPAGPCLHIAARENKIKTAKWLIETFGSCIVDVRDQEKLTALEAVIYQMRGVRLAQIELGRGYIHSPKSARCLLILKGNNQPSQNEITRTRYGCSCGECIRYCVSPRMLRLILLHIEKLCDMAEVLAVQKKLKNKVDTDNCVLENLLSQHKRLFWIYERGPLQFLGPAMQILKGIAGCLREGFLPSKENVLDSLCQWVEEERFDSESTAEVEAAIATVKSAPDGKDPINLAVAVVFSINSYVLQDLVEDTEVDDLPECGNDLEFRWVSSILTDGATILSQDTLNDLAQM